MLTPSNTLPWLLASCDRTGSPSLGAPFRATIKGQEWVIATDGYRLSAALVEAFPDALKLDLIDPELAPKNPNIEKLLTEARLDTYETTAEALADFCRPEPSEPCAICRGKGVARCNICHGRGEVTTECDHCDHEHKCPCLYCEDGVADCECQAYKPRPGVIRGEVIDRALMWEIVQHLSGPASLRFGVTLAAISIVGPGWVFLLMPIRYTPEEAKELPRFEEVLA